MNATESRIDIKKWSENGVTVRQRITDGSVPEIEVSILNVGETVPTKFYLDVYKADSLRLFLAKALHGYT